MNAKPDTPNFSPRKLYLAMTAAVMLAAPATTWPISMQEMFDDINGGVNVTEAGAYRGQAMNYYTAGSLYMRMPKREYRVATITPPKIRAGCDGIDLQAGGFSFISMDEFVASLRNIMANAPGYFFKLAIQNLCPSCDNIMQALKDMADQVNRFGINSCEAAKGIVNAMTPADWQKKEETNNARIFGTGANIFDDFAKSWDKVSTALSTFPGSLDKANTTLDQAAAASPEAKEQIEEERSKGNLTWKAIAQLSTAIGGMDTESKQIMMGLVGAYIVDPTKAAPQYVPPFDPITIEKLVGQRGQTSVQLSVLSCVDNESVDGCLTVGPATVTTKPFITLVEEKMNKIVDAIEGKYGGGGSAASLPDDAKAFVQVVDLPVLSMLNVATSMPHSGMARAMIDKYSELIAAKLAAMYIDMTFNGIEKGVLVSSRNGGSLAMAEYTKLHDRIRSLRQENQTRIAQISASLGHHQVVMSELALMEKQLYSSMSEGLRQNLAWANRGK